MSTPTADARGRRFCTGARKWLVYLRIALHVAVRYALRPRLFACSPLAYARFLRRAGVLLLTFRQNKVVRVAGGYKLQLYLPAYPSPAFFHALEGKLLRQPPAPVTVVFSMTKACSYRCRHCYQQRDGGPDLPEELLLQTAREILEGGTAMFDVEGGEPLLRLPRLLALLRALDSRAELWVNTTGAGLTPEVLAELKAAGLFGLMVSLHSPDPASHDLLTGVPGSFDTACAALRLCSASGLTAAANCVLAEAELRRGELSRLLDLARDLGCHYVQLIHPKPAGGWLGRTEQMQQEPDLLAEIRAQHLLYNSAQRPDHPSLSAQAFEEAPGHLGCTAGGVDRFYVNATGEVQPCEFLNLSLGKVGEEPFAVIMARMRLLFPVPCEDWLCCTLAPAIAQAFAATGEMRTPLPRTGAEPLLAGADRGRPTALYRRLGLYRPAGPEP